MVYLIRVKGHLGPQWTDWFGGMAITLEEDGDTLLTCLEADQAALIRRCFPGAPRGSR